MGVTVNRAAPVDVVPTGPVFVTQRIYWDVTRTRLLEEGHPDARFLAYAEGAAITPEIAGQVVPAVVVPAVAEVAVEPAPERVDRRRRRMREDRQLAPGVVADTSIDGEVHTLASEPAKTLSNGVNERG